MFMSNTLDDTQKQLDIRLTCILIFVFSSNSDIEMTCSYLLVAKIENKQSIPYDKFILTRRTYPIGVFYMFKMTELAPFDRWFTSKQIST